MVRITDLTISTYQAVEIDILTMTAVYDSVLQGLTFTKGLEYGPWTSVEINLVEQRLGELFSHQYEEHLGKVFYFSSSKEPHTRFRGKLVSIGHGGLEGVYVLEDNTP